MTLFFLLAALLVVAAIALLLVGPLRARARAEGDPDLRATNVALARERRAALAAALADGAIDEATHATEIAQLERDLAGELEAGAAHAPRDGAVPAMVLVAVFLPIAAGALYLRLGDPGAVTRPEGAAVAGAPGGGEASGGAGGGVAADPSAPALADLLPRLEERLASQPDDVEGWRLLGRSYLGIEEFERAVPPLRRAIALEEDATTLGQLAEAVAMSRGGQLAGEPATLLERAVELDPSAPQGLWLLAIARQQAGEHTRALQLFERLRAIVAADTAAVATIDDMMANSRTALGEAPRDPAERATVIEPTDEVDAADATGANAAARVSLRVDLSDEARADATPEQTVFVYARASEGPPMPLAVARYTVADLPVEVTLDESMAMLPTMSLARFPNVTVGARISRTGEPLAASGDWFAERQDVAVGAEDDAPLELLIDARRP